MKISSSLVIVICSVAPATAFMPLAHPRWTALPKSLRANYLDGLSNMAVGGENLVDTIDQFDQYLEKVQDATTRAQERINNLSKERDATRLMLDRTRLQTEMDKQELTDDFKAKEQSLKRDMDEMQLQLVAEKETVKDYQERVKRIEAERQALDDEFSKLKLQYERDSNNWNEKYRSEQEVHRLEIANARDEASRRQMEADRALQEAQRRLASVEEQLSAKIKEHEAAIRALKDNMKVKEDQLQSNISNMREQISKIEHEKQTLVAQFDSKKELLEREIARLGQEVNSEKQKHEVNEERRRAVESELETLQTKYEHEIREMTAKYDAEQAAKIAEEARLKQELENHRMMAAEAASELEKRLSFLQNQLTSKEQKIQSYLQGMEQRLEDQEKEYKNKIDEMGTELTNNRLNAHKEKMALAKQYEERDKVRQLEIDKLTKRLESEKEKIQVNQEMISRIVTKRIQLDAELGELKRRYQTESMQWSAKYHTEQEAHRKEVALAKANLEEQEAKAKVEFDASQTKFSRLLDQLSKKEQEKDAAIRLFKEEMSLQEKELKEKIAEMGNQVTNLKIQAHQEKILAADEYRVREQKRQLEIEDLHKRLQQAKANILVNQEMTSRVIGKRVEVEKELGELKRQYIEDSKEWTDRFEKEQEAHRRELALTKAELEDQLAKANIEAGKLQQSILSLMEQLSKKELEKQVAVREAKERTETTEKGLKDKLANLGDQVTNLKIQGHKEKMRLADEYRSLDQVRLSTIDDLTKLLSQEQEKVRVNQGMTNRIVAQRIDIERELGELKRRFALESSEWSWKQSAQEEANRMSLSQLHHQLEEQETAAKIESSELQRRIDYLIKQLSKKEQEKQSIITSSNNEKRTMREDFREKLAEMGDHLTNLKLQGHLEKMSLVDEYALRDNIRQEEIEALKKSLEQAKDNILVNHQMTNQIITARIDLDRELGELKKRFALESTEWSWKHAAEQEARMAEVAKAKAELEDQEGQAKMEAKLLNDRITTLMEQLSRKEQDKQAIMLQSKAQMEAMEKETKEKLAEMGDRATKDRLEAHRERQSLSDNFNYRESAVLLEVDRLRKILDSEKDKIRINQEMTARIVSQRMELDAEVGALKHQYETASSNWSAKYEAEQQARRKELANANCDLERQEAKAKAEAEHLHRRVLSLQKSLEAKELEKQGIIAAMATEMKDMEAELKKKLAEMGNGATNLKLEANRQMMALVSDYEKRDHTRQLEIDRLQRRLETELDNSRVHKEMTSQLVAHRMALDAELGELKRRYQVEHKEWSSKYAAEQDSRQRAIAEVKAQLEEKEAWAHREAEEYKLRVSRLHDDLMVKEREKLSTLFAVKNEMSARETELQRKLHELGSEMTNLKLAAHKEKIEYSRLEHKVEELEKQHRQQLEAKEQEKMQTIQELQKQLWEQEDALKRKEMEFKAMLNDMGSEATLLKIEANREKIALQKQIDELKGAPSQDGKKSSNE